MKRLFLMLLVVIMFIWSGSVLAYTINDDPTVNKVGMGWTLTDKYEPLGWSDAIGADNFDTTSIDVDLSGDILTITMHTRFDGAVDMKMCVLGHCWSDTVYAADLGLDLDLDGTYEYGVKLTHTGPDDTDYSAALYKGGTWESSYDVWEGNASFNWVYGEFYPDDNNRNAWVKMDGGTPKGDVTINITESGDLYAWTLEIDKTLFGSDLGDKMGIFWATGTCANDVVEGKAVVPIPPTILLLGSGLLGFILLNRRKKVNT